MATRKLTAKQKAGVKAGKAGARSIKAQTAAVQKKANALIKDKIPKDIERALTTVGVVVGNKSLEYTPMEFTSLVNSMYHIVEVIPNGYQARVGFTQEYARPLHSPKPGGKMDGWSPRPIDKKLGPATNMNAKQGFLTIAAEEEKETIRRIITSDLQL